MSDDYWMKEKLENLRAENAKEKASALEKQRQQHRLETAELKNYAEIDKIEAKNVGDYNLEMLKAQLQPKQLANLEKHTSVLKTIEHEYNTRERADIHEKQTDLMIFEAQLKMRLMEREHELHKSGTMSAEEIRSLANEILEDD